MKILQVAPVSNRFNAFLLPHLKALESDGYEIELACATKEPLDPAIAHLRQHEIAFDHVPASRKNNQAFQEMKRLIGRENFDMIHTYTPTVSAITRIAAQKSQATILYTPEGFDFYQGCPRRNRMLAYPVEKWLAQTTDILITFTQEDYEAAQALPLRRGGEVCRIEGLGIEISDDADPKKRKALMEQFSLSEKDEVLIFAAELSEQKNQRMLINMMEILLQYKPRTCLFLLGEGPKKAEYQALIRQKKLATRIFLPGQPKEVALFLQLADLVVSSSKQEGMPVSIMEALAHGKPVVATRVRGHTDVIQQPGVGKLVASEEEMVEAVIRILDHPENYHGFLPEKFSTEAVVAETRKIYCSAKSKVLDMRKSG